VIRVICYSAGKCIKDITEEDDSNMTWDAGKFTLFDEEDEIKFFWSGDFSIENTEA
jgi:hypothetical protein